MYSYSEGRGGYFFKNMRILRAKRNVLLFWGGGIFFQKYEEFWGPRGMYPYMKWTHRNFRGETRRKPKQKKIPKSWKGKEEKREKEREREEREREREKEYHEKLEEKTVYMIDGFLFFSDILSSENVILFEKFRKFIYWSFLRVSPRKLRWVHFI